MMKVEYDFYDLKHLGFDCHVSEYGYRLHDGLDSLYFEDMDAVDEFVRDVTREADYKVFVENYAEK